MATKRKTAIIIGAGPAGLTAAYELLETTDIVPVVYEDTNHVGGLSATAIYKGNRIDVGGHRFFSKSDRVIDWWLNMLPLQRSGGGEHTIAYHRNTRTIPNPEAGPDPDAAERVMLVRQRKSRIYFNRNFFEYPIRLDGDTLKKLGTLASLRIGSSYLRRAFFPITPPELPRPMRPFEKCATAFPRERPLMRCLPQSAPISRQGTPHTFSV